MLALKSILTPIPAMAAINAALCTRGGGNVVPKMRDDGTVEYWCVGGQFDGKPVINTMD